MGFRPAILADCALLYEWRQEQEAAPWYEAEPTSYEQHERWLQERLADPLVKLLIWENDAYCPLGMIRIDSNGEVAYHAVDARATQAMLEAVAEYATDYGGRLKVTLDAANVQKATELKHAGFSTYPAVALVYTLTENGR